LKRFLNKESFEVRELGQKEKELRRKEFRRREYKGTVRS